MSISEIILKGLFDFSRYGKHGLRLADDDKDPIVDFFEYNKLVSSVPDPEFPDLKLRYYSITDEGLKALRGLRRHHFVYLLVIVFACLFGSVGVAATANYFGLSYELLGWPVFILCACFWYRLIYVLLYGRLRVWFSENAIYTISILLSVGLLVGSIALAVIVVP